MAVKTNLAKYSGEKNYNAIVGTTADVAIGKATHTTVQQAYNDIYAAVGFGGSGSMLILENAPFAGSLVAGSFMNLDIHGRNRRNSQITGVTINQGSINFSNISVLGTTLINSSDCSFCNVEFYGNVTINNNKVNNILSPFVIYSGTIVDNNTVPGRNLILGISDL